MGLHQNGRFCLARVIFHYLTLWSLSSSICLYSSGIIFMCPWETWNSMYLDEIELKECNFNNV